MLLEIPSSVVLTFAVSMASHTALMTIVLRQASLAVVNQVFEDVPFVSTLLAHKVSLFQRTVGSRGLRWRNLLCVMGR